MRQAFTLMKEGEKDVNELGHWLRTLNNNFINSISLNNILLKSHFRVSHRLISLLLKVFVTWISVGHRDRSSLRVRNPAQCFTPSCIAEAARLLTCLNISVGPLVSACLGP